MKERNEEARQTEGETTGTEGTEGQGKSELADRRDGAVRRGAIGERKKERGNGERGREGGQSAGVRESKGADAMEKEGGRKEREG